ncbi:MAG: hypothetical protein KDF56_17990, partial [Ottowia sp.]|nr:hypothetical protein [Ottowia sp.]
MAAALTALALILTACGGGSDAGTAGSSGGTGSGSGSGTSTAPTSAGPSIAGCPMFPASAVFNTRLDGLPVHADSSRWINADASASWTRTFATASGPDTRTFWPIDNRPLHADWGTTVDATQLATYWGIPYNVLDGTAVRSTWPVASFAAADSPTGDYPGAVDESDCAVATATGWGIHANCQTLPA